MCPLPFTRPTVDQEHNFEIGGGDCMIHCRSAFLVLNSSVGVMLQEIPDKQVISTPDRIYQCGPPMATLCRIQINVLVKQYFERLYITAERCPHQSGLAGGAFNVYVTVLIQSSVQQGLEFLTIAYRVLDLRSKTLSNYLLTRVQGSPSKTDDLS